MKIVEDQKLILGPPGTGKTTRCLQIVEQELAAGVAPNRIAYVSFTKKAVTEAITRACAKFDYDENQFPYFRTLHSLGFRMAGLNKTEVIEQHHLDELGELVGYKLSAVKLNPEDGFPYGADKGDAMLFALQLARARCVSIEQQHHDLMQCEFSLFELRRMQQALADYKRANGVVDYADMIELVIKAGSTVNVDVVIIDEAQDLSTLQWRFCEQVFANAKRLYIAGDDDQAIYKWGGADVETFLSLEGEREVLAHSYRLTRAVYAVASEVIKGVSKRFEKNWKPRDEEGEVIRLSHIDQYKFDDEGTTLVLVRNGYMMKEIEERLRNEGKLYETKHGPSVSQEHALTIRTYEHLRRGETATGIEVRRLYGYLRVGSGIARGFKAIAAFSDDEDYSLEELQNKNGFIAEGIWHEALQGIALTTREYYLNIRRNGHKLEDEAQIKVSTIHAAKGGEADNVVVLNDMSYRTFSGFQADPDDEHRVFYVALTRAKHKLVIIDSGALRSFRI